jgi:hypothetical protein
MASLTTYSPTDLDIAKVYDMDLDTPASVSVCSQIGFYEAIFYLGSNINL